MSFGARLDEAVRRARTPLCVGLDPRWESLPLALRLAHGDGNRPHDMANAAAAYESFCLSVLELVAPFTAIVKPQMAFFEGCGPKGLKAMRRIIARARDMGLLVILDAKRGDIASTATAYAEAAFGGTAFGNATLSVWQADALTVNPYLGEDAVAPFIAEARKSGAGLFVLVRTSNPGAGLFQDLVCDEEPLWKHVAHRVAEWNQPGVDASGWGDVGAVVGATYPEELAWTRQACPRVPLLVPGYGAQGASLESLKAAFRADGTGAVINSSRAILFPGPSNAPDWKDRIAAAASDTSTALAAIAGLS